MRRASLALLLTAASVGCGPAEPSPAVNEAEITSDAMDGAVTENTLFLTVLRASDEPAPDVAATRRGMLRARDQLANFYGTACASFALDEPGRRVTVRLTNCRGSGALRQVSGTLTYTFTPLASGVQVQVTARGLTVGAATVDVLDATASMRVQAGVRELRIETSQLEYRGGLGRSVVTSLRRPSVTRGNLLTNCYEYEGGRNVMVREADGTVGGYTLEVNRYHRCAGQCPRAVENVLVLSSLDSTRVLRATYNGLALARWTYSVGGARVATGTWRLDCS